MDDSPKPKPDVSPVFISRADLPSDLPPPLFVTKAASSEDAATKCWGTSPSTPTEPTKSDAS